MSKNDDKTEQISIASMISKWAQDPSSVSASDLEKAILKLKEEKLKKSKEEQEKRAQEEKARLEREQKEREEKEKREQEEKARLEREKKEREEKEKQENKKTEGEFLGQGDFFEQTSVDLPLDWDNFFSNDTSSQDVHTESISDALVLSLSNLGRVDIEYISSITGSNYKTVIGALKGTIYQNPETWGECFYKGWETSEEYLSGNMKRKLDTARKANEAYHGHFSDNVKAIEKVLPPTVANQDIYVTLGSPWVPADIIDDFIEYLLGDFRKYVSGKIDESDYRTKHDELTGTWEIPNKGRYQRNVRVTKTFGTDRMSALYIIEKTLNMKSVAVTDEVACLTNASGKKRVVNKAETVLAIEKQEKIIETFQKWVWLDKDRKNRLETIFENNYTCIIRRSFDGSFLEFDQMSPQISLYPYQKNAVARILFTPNTLLAHDVGAGKTYVMIAAGMEMRRMGISKKNMYVVPNNIVGQWHSIFLNLYPNAKLMCVEPKSFTPSKRKATLEKMRDGDFDGIIIAYSCFELIKLSKDYYRDQLLREREKIQEAISDAVKSTTKLKNRLMEVNKALVDLCTTVERLDDTVYFDELGVTRLFVDEAHNFKNVPLDTKTDKVLGISATGSKVCQDMMDKVHLVQRLNDGAGVVLATGTPITNSITDAYIMQLYLQSGELAMLDLQSFDSWIGMFAERSTEFEIDVDTNSYRLATRFSKFHNLPELTALLASVADFHQMDERDMIPEHDGYSDALVTKSLDLGDYLDEISQRAESVRSGSVSRKEDNMLKITTDGRKAALDIRLVKPKLPFTYQSKVARCVENVIDIFIKTSFSNSTQVVFCDTSTPKVGFNMYDEVKRLLVRYGVPEDKIAYVHDADTEAERLALFDRVRRGEVRILLGSTFKLGLGVNIQDKLVALHHLDVPWRPADMTQREGRILRQGNENKKVQIFRYITEGSFDAYSWQLLETKQRFISNLLSGSLSERSSGDIQDTVLSYAEVKALAIGNPLIKKRVELANELSRYLALQRKTVERRLQMEAELKDIPKQVAMQERRIRSCTLDNDFYSNWKKQNPSVVDVFLKREEVEIRKILREKIYRSVMEHILEPKESTLMQYRGFDIILPTNMMIEKPFVYLQREGRYYVELGDSDVGTLLRIDHFLDDLPKLLTAYQMEHDKLLERKKGLKDELEKNENYGDLIDEYKSKIAVMDKKLGIKKDERN